MKIEEWRLLVTKKDLIFGGDVAPESMKLLQEESGQPGMACSKTKHIYHSWRRRLNLMRCRKNDADEARG